MFFGGYQTAISCRGCRRGVLVVLQGGWSVCPVCDAPEPA
jgi:hypothetical protein